ncbi:MAG: hypothetical protein ACRC7C_15215, partial [Beijerinckiaceae bacterium]
ASLPRLLDTEQERSRALDFVMRVAGPAETMNPEALALYRTFETMLENGQVVKPTVSKPARKPKVKAAPTNRTT